MSDPFYFLAVPFIIWQLLLIRHLVKELRRDKQAWAAQRAEWAKQDAHLAELEQSLGIYINSSSKP